MSKKEQAEQAVKPKRPRGRPRDLAAKEAILRAVRSLLSEGGPSAVTMAGVASMAGVSKPTVYRWWPDSRALVLAALLSAEGEDDAPRRGGQHRSALRGLRKQLQQLAAQLTTLRGRQLVSLLAAAESHEELLQAVREQFFLSPRAEALALIERAVQDGELDASVHAELAIEQLYGALLVRLLLGQPQPSQAQLDTLFAHVLGLSQAPKKSQK